MSYHYWFVPALIILELLAAYLCCRSNESGLPWTKDIYLWISFVDIWILATIWPIVSKMSTNMIFDSFLYDILMVTCYAVPLIIMGKADGFTIWQYIGMGVVILGFIMLKLDKETITLLGI